MTKVLAQGPVRIGNDAVGQVQHDVYGSAISAAAAHVECGGKLEHDEQHLLVGYGQQVCATWRQPDSGLWEVPGPKRHYVHSKLLCWSALDALTRLDEAGQLRAPREVFLQEREAVREAIEMQGYCEAPDGKGSYVGAFGEDWADASLLIMARLGFHDPITREPCPRLSESGKTSGAKGCCCATGQRSTVSAPAKARSVSAGSGQWSCWPYRAG